jgi:hypothetical protein
MSLNFEKKTVLLQLMHDCPGVDGGRSGGCSALVCRIKLSFREKDVEQTSQVYVGSSDLGQQDWCRSRSFFNANPISKYVQPNVLHLKGRVCVLTCLLGQIGLVGKVCDGTGTDAYLSMEL